MTKHFASMKIDIPNSCARSDNLRKTLLSEKNAIALILGNDHGNV